MPAMTCRQCDTEHDEYESTGLPSNLCQDCRLDRVLDDVLELDSDRRQKVLNEVWAYMTQ